MKAGGEDIKITIVGIKNCPRCAKIKEMVERVLDELKTNAELEEVHDLMEILRLGGPMVTPMVLVDGEVVSKGKIPQRREIVSWLGK